MFSKDEDEVADLFQDILVNLWKGFSKFRGESNIKTWIYRVSLNTCISSDRKKKRKGETVPLDMNINLFDDSQEDMKQVRMLQNRISRLGPFDRAIVLLWLENLSYDEIGAVVGITAKIHKQFTVDKRLRAGADIFTAKFHRFLTKFTVTEHTRYAFFRRRSHI